MHASSKQKLNQDLDFHPKMEINKPRDFYSHLKLEEHAVDDVRLDEGVSDCGEEEQEDDEFSFNCGELNTSPIAAEDAFINGQIKPALPLFDRDFVFPGHGPTTSLHENLPVKKIFVEMNGEDDNHAMTSSIPGGDEIVGPYCEWSSRKAVEASQDQVCKKSNSTGFSRIWRFKEFGGRCNSDGRDAFVFLNNAGHAPSPPSNQASGEKSEKPESTTAKIKKEVKKSSSKTAPLSAHEVYLRSKAKQERRRSYLPYRPELMGFFTNVNGGLTKNVHPY